MTVQFSKTIINKYLINKWRIPESHKKTATYKLNYYYLKEHYFDSYSDIDPYSIGITFMYCLEQGLVEQEVIDDINEFMIGSL
jgi:hypothetical protein